MDDFLTDQQQAARVRGWLRVYAPAAIVALVVGIGGYFGYAQWQAREARQSGEASELFEELRAVLGSSNRDSAEELHQRLLTEYPDSGYADHSRLMMAKEYVDTTRPVEAAAELEALVASTSDSDLRQLARRRLARVYLYLDRPGDGLEALDAEPPSEAWEQLTADMRGDLYRALGRIDEAREAYSLALERSGQVDASWIRLKLDHLSGMGATQAESESEAEESQEAEESVAEVEPEAEDAEEVTEEAGASEEESGAAAPPQE